MNAELRTAGIDVGGRVKGYHVVMLRAGHYEDQFTSTDAAAVALWCRQKLVQVIAVDAPCRWTEGAGGRPAERALLKAGVRCFFTPERAVAVQHPRDYYGWMLCGEKLFTELERSHSLLQSLPLKPGQQVCFETFPHAIACALTGRALLAKEKRKDRAELLLQHGIHLPERVSQDFLDAALCALAAESVARNGSCSLYGEQSTGYLVVPRH
jgi:predicted nuclease with RNAse H fold